MAVTDISELRKKRQAKQTKNMLIRVFLVLLICGAVIVAVLTGDMWFPYLKGVISSVPGGIQHNSAELAEGQFPLMVEGGMGYQLTDMDGSLALLDKSRFHVYSTDGKIMYERQHTYANPILCTADSKALIYDEGGKEFSLEGKYKNIYSKSADDVIYIAKLSKSDYAAVVTKSDKYLAMLKVYDPDGDLVFTYYSYDSRIINITFNKSSSGCVVTVLTAEGGQLVSKMIRFDFNDTEPKWISDSVPTLALDTEFTEDGIIMIGDTLTAGFDNDGKLTSRYVYSSPIFDYDCRGNIAAVITENSDIRRKELLIFESSDCMSPAVSVLGKSAKKVCTDAGRAYVLSDSGIDVYNPDASAAGSIALEDDYDDLCKCGKYIFLLGYDSINRISYNS